MIDLNAAFDKVRLAILGLLVSCFVGCGSSPPDEATGPIRFTDVTSQVGLGVVQLTGGADVDTIIESIGAGGAWLDYDGDGDTDLYLVQGGTRGEAEGPPDVLLRNDGDHDGDGLPEFTDVTAESGLGDTRWSFGAATADYDNDGDTDLLLTNWGPNRLYRNNGDGTFTDVAPGAGVDDPRWGISAAWSDVDRDGDLDLYVTNYVEFTFDRYPTRGEPGARGEPACNWKGLHVFCGPRNLEAAGDALFRNDGDADGDGIPTFTDVTREAGLAIAEPFFGIAVVFFDAEGDGDDDLYVANDSMPNLYFINQGDGRFEEAGILSGLAYNEKGHEQAGMGIAVGDYTGNGRMDLFVTNFSHDHDTLYRNDGDWVFTDRSFQAGVGLPSKLKLGWGAEFLDLDNDGWEDLYVAQGHVYPQVDGAGTGSDYRQANSLFRNLGDGTFADVGATAGSGLAVVSCSRAILPIDLDEDGDQDLVVTTWNGEPQWLRNDSPAANWVAVRLEGHQSNRDGIGARVTVVAGGRTQVREIRRNRSVAGSSLPVAHFGLGGADRIDRIEIRWPSGRIDLHQAPESNRILRFSEGTAP